MLTRHPATSWLASRPIDRFKQTFGKTTRTLLSPNGTSIIMPTHSSPLARQALCELFHDEPARGLEALRSIQAANMSPGCDSVSFATPRTSLRRSPVLGSWTADEILSAARWISRHPGLDYYARSRWAQTDPYHQPLEHRSSQRLRAGCPHGLSPESVHPPRPGFCTYHPRLCLAFQPEAPQAEQSSSRPQGLPLPVGDTQLPHPPPPHRYPSRPMQVRSQPWRNLTQNSLRITPPLCSLLITKSHDGIQLPRARTPAADGDVLGHPRSPPVLGTFVKLVSLFLFSMFLDLSTNISVWFQDFSLSLVAGSQASTTYRSRGVQSAGVWQRRPRTCRMYRFLCSSNPVVLPLSRKLSILILFASLISLAGLNCFFFGCPPCVSMFCGPSAPACVADLSQFSTLMTTEGL